MATETEALPEAVAMAWSAVQDFIRALWLHPQLKKESPLFSDVTRCLEEYAGLVFSNDRPDTGYRIRLANEVLVFPDPRAFDERGECEACTLSYRPSGREIVFANRQTAKLFAHILCTLTDAYTPERLFIFPPAECAA